MQAAWGRWEYVPGHDSLSEEEDVYVIPKRKKKVVKANDVIRPRTRSCSVNNAPRTVATEETVLPPPPALPVDRTQIMRVPTNEGIVQEKAAKNLANRKKLTDTHTAGRTSFAQIRNQMKNVKSACSNTTKTRIYPKTRKGHLKRAKQNGENLEENKEKSDEEQMVEIDLAAHGPNWLVEEDEDGDAGSDEDDGSNEVDGDEDAADEDEDGDA
ncbi:hypothetical protein POM88_025391 [Heracleum sosnowskyi]|uniref:Uncharacterized protein n=1 Tax=Heracleum sosnowskyi TaxID=360622 RepID=A0AAD8H4C3_9APIA|nr:hypothetical protein POM88_045336 [Heracleum sosnowskyi]KAK1378647.1 hypothetical protein POM88_025391 [Heracleum sosnowskyi]